VNDPRTSGVFRTKVQERFCIETRPDPCGVILFGASGDLAERKLYPSLFHLKLLKQLPDRFYVVGVGRTALSDDAFREKVRGSLKGGTAADRSEFLERFYYHPLRYDQPADYTALCARLDQWDARWNTRGNRLMYLALPPTLYEKVVEQLGKAEFDKEREGGRGWSRLVIEKPFGRDRASAQALARKLRHVFDETQTYRIDHYLGKETVQNILVLRFANILFEPVWNRSFVDHVQITVAESLGVGHRAGYYEEAGCLRDMFQNHLLQLLCVTAMETPAGFQADRVRDESVKALRAVRPWTTATVDKTIVRGQYTAGAVDGHPVPGYRQEPDVPAESRTETFVAMKLRVDNWRWQGVPFYLRSGKRLAERRSEIVVQFKHVPHSLFQPLQPTDLGANRLILRIQPREGISLTFDTKHPGPKLCMSTVEMDFDYEESFGEPPEAYERLFLDAMAGDQTLFTRSDWIDLSWALLDPVHARWADTGGPAPYAAGGWGPEAADRLLAADERAWAL
jgi:glucose-6-phosphate 1-dehydrogenase